MPLPDWLGLERWKIITVSSKISTSKMIGGDKLTFLGGTGQDLRIKHGGTTVTLATGCTYTATGTMEVKHNWGFGDREIRLVAGSPNTIECHPVPGAPPNGAIWTAEDQGQGG